MNAPTISAIIPCYNGAAFLRETLESVLSQTLPVLEVIVVDDGSADDSGAIAESFGPIVRVIRQSNQGESVARNRGIDEAKGEWIAFVDADDLWSPEKLRLQCQQISDDVIGVYTAVTRFGAQQGEITFDVSDKERQSLEFVALNSPIHISSLLVRKTHAPRFPTWTKYGEDMVFQMELVLAGRLAYVDEVVTHYRIHKAGQSRWMLIELQWNATVQRWMTDNRDRVPDAARRRVQSTWHARTAREHESLAFGYRQRSQYLEAARHYVRAVSMGNLSGGISGLGKLGPHFLARMLRLV